jgi:hypothetical protein
MQCESQAVLQPDFVPGVRRQPELAPSFLRCGVVALGGGLCRGRDPWELEAFGSVAVLCDLSREDLNAQRVDRSELLETTERIFAHLLTLLARAEFSVDVVLEAFGICALQPAADDGSSIGPGLCWPELPAVSGSSATSMLALHSILGDSDLPADALGHSPTRWPASA